MILSSYYCENCISLSVLGLVVYSCGRLPIVVLRRWGKRESRCWIKSPEEFPKTFFFQLYRIMLWRLSKIWISRIFWLEIVLGAYGDVQFCFMTHCFVICELFYKQSSFKNVSGRNGDCWASKRGCSVGILCNSFYSTVSQGCTAEAWVTSWRLPKIPVRYLFSPPESVDEM